jgi:integrase
MHCYLKQRKNGIWYIWEYDGATGQCNSVSARTRDRAAAQKKLAEHILKLPQRKLLNDATVVWVLLRYWELYAKDIFASDTVRRVMGLAAEHIPSQRVYDWPIGEQKAFAAKLAAKGSTQRRYWGVVRAAIQWAVDGGELPSLPALMKIQATDGEGVRPFTLGELQLLAEACLHEHERRFFLLTLTTGCRPGATLDLTWDRINAETGVVDYAVPGRKLTKKRRAKAPLCPTARAYLNDRRSIGPVLMYRTKRKSRPIKGYKMTFKRIAERSKVTGTAYGIRKAVSIWLRKEGVHEWDIKGMLGHAIGGETERYAHYRPEYMRAAADSVERLLRRINPSWLCSYFAVEVSRETQVLDGTGGRDRDRTCDPYHVKDGVFYGFQWLKPANDGKW